MARAKTPLLKTAANSALQVLCVRIKGIAVEITH